MIPVLTRFWPLPVDLPHAAAMGTRWNSHEPASILHHLVILPNPYNSMRFLIDRGIDMTIKDYRWDSNAAGCARHGYNDEKMAQWRTSGLFCKSSSERLECPLSCTYYVPE